MRQVEAKTVVTIQFDGTEEEFINLAEELSLRETGNGLDTLDAGDATGYISNRALRKSLDWTLENEFDDGTEVLTYRNRICTVKVDTKFFSWSGEWA